MKLFFDTNVVLDLLAAREPFFRDSCLVHSLCARGVHEGLVADFTFCTIAYVLRKGKSVEEMRAALRGIHDILTVVPVGPVPSPTPLPRSVATSRTKSNCARRWLSARMRY